MGAGIFVLPLGDSGSQNGIGSLSVAEHAKYLPCRFQISERKLSDGTIYHPAGVTSYSTHFLYADVLIDKLRDVVNFPPIQFVSVGPSTSSTRFGIVCKHLDILGIVGHLVEYQRSSSGAPAIASVPTLHDFSVPLPTA